MALWRRVTAAAVVVLRAADLGCGLAGLLQTFDFGSVRVLLFVPVVCDGIVKYCLCSRCTHVEFLFFLLTNQGESSEAAAAVSRSLKKTVLVEAWDEKVKLIFLQLWQEKCVKTPNICYPH